MSDFWTHVVDSAIALGAAGIPGAVVGVVAWKLAKRTKLAKWARATLAVGSGLGVGIGIMCWIYIEVAWAFANAMTASG